jgi:tetratricopeptide (TPR) repeat protein
MQERNDIYRKDSPRLPSRRGGRRSQSSSVPSDRKDVEESAGRSIVSELYAPEQARPNRPDETAAPVSNRKGRGGRRRGRRQREAAKVQQKKLIWLFVLVLVLLVYVVVLASSLWRSAQQSEQPAVQARPATPSTATPLMGEGDVMLIDPPALDDLAAQAQERIADWKQALQIWQQVRVELDRLPRRTAIERLEEARALAPDFQDLKWMLARLYYDQKRFAQAAEVLQEVLKVEPMRQEAREMWGRSLLGMRQFEAALAVAQWMLELDGFQDVGNELAATALLGLQQYEAAIPHLQRQLMLNRGNVPALTLLASAYAQQGAHESAIQLLEEVIDIDSSNAMAYYELAVSQARLGASTRCIETLRSAIDRFGLAFVSAWLGSEAFDAIREEAAFVRLFRPEMPQAEPEPEAEPDLS